MKYAVSYFCGSALAGFKPVPYSGEVRLVGGTFLSEGVVEIYLNGKWRRVCSENISSVEANVICWNLGYDSAVSWYVTAMCVLHISVMFC